MMLRAECRFTLCLVLSRNFSIFRRGCLRLQRLHGPTVVVVVAVVAVARGLESFPEAPLA